ncbi:MAG TPA: YlxR family protein [Thermodesulfobacteriota bacterium]
MPERTCLGCRSVHDKSSLVRLAKGPEGLLEVDVLGRLPGRGAYICPKEGCLKDALKKNAFGRALKTNVSLPPFELIWEGVRKGKAL